MPEKKDLPQSYSLYQIVSRLFGFQDGEGLNHKDATPLLEFILEQASLGERLQAFFNDKAVSYEATGAEGGENIRHLPPGYSEFRRFSNPSGGQKPDAQEIAKKLKINRDDWLAYLEKLRGEIKEAADRPVNESWDEVFVRSGFHSQGIVDEMKAFVGSLRGKAKKERLSSYRSQAERIRQGEADYIKAAKIVVAGYAQIPFWDDAKKAGEPSLATRPGKMREYKKVFQGFAKGSTGDSWKNISPAQLKKCRDEFGLNKDPSARTLRRWFSDGLHPLNWSVFKPKLVCLSDNEGLSPRKDRTDEEIPEF